MKSRPPSQKALEFRARFAHLRNGGVRQSGPEPVTGGAQHFPGPWFNSRTGARYLDKPSREAFWIWAKRHGVVPIRRAGCQLYAKADIDRVLLRRKSA